MAEQNLENISRQILKFNIDRGRTPLDPADLAKSIIMEAGELLEHFQRDNTRKIRGREIPEKNKDEIGYEVADILIYLLEFCYEMKIDLGEMTQKKIKKNGEKFPVGYQDEGGHEEYRKIKKLYREQKSQK